MIEKKIGQLKNGWKKIFKTFMEEFPSLQFIGYQECELGDQTALQIGELLKTMDVKQLSQWRVLSYREKPLPSEIELLQERDR